MKREADVIVLNTAPPFLKYVVLQEGILVLSKDESKRIDFELKSINGYFNFKPYQKMYNSRLLSKWQPL